MAQVVKNLAVSIGDMGSNPGSGKSPGEEMATHPVFLSGKPMDRGAWWAAKSWM